MKKLMKTLSFWVMMCAGMIFSFSACGTNSVLMLFAFAFLAFICFYGVHCAVEAEKKRAGNKGVENLIGAWIGEAMKKRFKNSGLVNALFNYEK